MAGIVFSKQMVQVYWGLYQKSVMELICENSWTLLVVSSQIIAHIFANSSIINVR